MGRLDMDATRTLTQRILLPSLIHTRPRAVCHTPRAVLLSLQQVHGWGQGCHHHLLQAHLPLWRCISPSLTSISAAVHGPHLHLRGLRARGYHRRPVPMLVTGAGRRDSKYGLEARVSWSLLPLVGERGELAGLHASLRFLACAEERRRKERRRGR